MPHRVHRFAYFVLSLALLCSGCGGGGGGSTPTPPSPPPAPAPPPSPPSPPPAPTPPVQMGSLEAELVAIEYGTANDNQWQRPSSQIRSTLASVIDEIINQRIDDAHTEALTIGYEVVVFTDTDVTPNRVHHILREVQQVPASASTGGGTYVFDNNGRDLVIESPHPLSDINTELQGIELYLATGAKALLLSGTRRDSSTSVGTCQAGFADSDASHNIEHLFQVSHEALDSGDTLFLQLHGFGSSTRATLQSQCDPTANAFLVNLSESVNDLSDPVLGGFIHELDAQIMAGGSITSCLYSPSQDVDINDRFTSSLGGTLNTQGRFNNSSPSLCDQPATANSRRFIHIEQSFDIRMGQGDRAIMNGHIVDAVETFFP
ncbi:hypothetical protein KFE80_11355 [bacterium SCSIO 12696]|nr:hypothetical protein KFE80_11355 [bacterium SCSIO 12696]